MLESGWVSQAGANYPSVEKVESIGKRSAATTGLPEDSAFESTFLNRLAKGARKTTHLLKSVREQTAVRALPAPHISLHCYIDGHQFILTSTVVDVLRMEHSASEATPRCINLCAESRREQENETKCPHYVQRKSGFRKPKTF